MRPVTRSTWLKAVVLSSLVLFVAQCGDESDIVIEEELDCLTEGFEGGSYTFIVDSMVDEANACPLEPFGLDPVGEQFGPVDLPAWDDIPTTIVIPDVPLVGTVTVDVSKYGKAIRIEGTEPITVTYPVIGDITAAVSGILCPDPKTTNVDAKVTVEVTSPLSCNVTALATGSL